MFLFRDCWASCCTRQTSTLWETGNVCNWEENHIKVKGNEMQQFEIQHLLNESQSEQHHILNDWNQQSAAGFSISSVISVVLSFHITCQTKQSHLHGKSISPLSVDESFFRAVYGVVAMVVRRWAIMVHPLGTGHSREIWPYLHPQSPWPQCVNSRLKCCVETGEDRRKLLLGPKTQPEIASYHTAHCSKKKEKKKENLDDLQTQKWLRG